MAAGGRSPDGARSYINDEPPTVEAVLRNVELIKVSYQNEILKIS